MTGDYKLNRFMGRSFSQSLFLTLEAPEILIDCQRTAVTAGGGGAIPEINATGKKNVEFMLIMGLSFKNVLACKSHRRRLHMVQKEE